MTKTLIKHEQFNINKNHRYKIDLKVNQNWKAASLNWIYKQPQMVKIFP